MPPKDFVSESIQISVGTRDLDQHSNTHWRVSDSLEIHSDSLNVSSCKLSRVQTNVTTVAQQYWYLVIIINV